MERATVALLSVCVAASLLLSCSDPLKPIERETLEEYESRLAQASSSSVVPSSSSSVPFSSSAELSSSSEAPSSSSVVPFCGGEQYNPNTQFCFYGTVFEKCEGQEYNPSNADCDIGVLRKECGSGKYIVTTQFCFSDAKYDKCGGEEYTPETEACCDASKYILSTHFCSGNTVYGKCGGEYTPGTEDCCGNSKYTLSTHFCSGSTIYSKCGGEEYNPATYFCLNNAITPLCGGQTFTSSQFCSGNAIHNKCSGSEYNPATYFCLNGAITPLCGGQQFTSSQFCSGNAVHDKCGESEYNPATQFCYNLTAVYDKCGNSEYDPVQYYCHNGSPQTKPRCGARNETFNPDLYECVDNSKIYLKAPVSYGGKNYEAVLIGSQTWMTENLNHNVSGSKCYGEGGQVATGYDNSGNPIAFATLSSEEVQANCVKYGRLYDWSTAMDQNICPLGWHIPSNAEWDELKVTAVGDYGLSLKATSWPSWNNTTDKYGFSALPGGYGEADGSFRDIGKYSGWWSASEFSNYVYYRGIYDYADDLYDWTKHVKSDLLSIRCVWDRREAQPPTQASGNVGR